MEREFALCQFETFARSFFAFLKPAERAVNWNYQAGRLIIVGMDFSRALKEFCRELELSLSEIDAGIEIVRLKRVRIEGDRPFEFRLRFGVAFRGREGQAA